MTTLWSGLAVGALYALVALGYNVVFLAAGTFNFAQAGLLMLGVFLTYWGLATAGLPSLVVILLAMAAPAGAALVIERVAARPSTDQRVHLVTTIGAATILTGLAERIWGADPLAVPALAGDGSHRLLGGVVTTVELTMLALVVALASALAVASRRTMIGLAALAVSEDPEAARGRGINTRLYSLGGFVLAGAIAGMAGAVAGPKTFAFTGLAAAPALQGFVAMALGGYGSIGGGLAAGLVVGVTEAQDELHRAASTARW